MEPATIGFSVIGILQLAQIVMTGRVSAKLDSKVDKELCAERREICSDQVKEDRRYDRNETHAIERKIGRHVHNNGDGVKFLPEGG